MLANGAFAILALAVLQAQAAEDTYPCVLQFDANVKCVLDLVGSEEAELVENRTKTIFHTKCAPEYPMDCFAEFEAAKKCYYDTKEQLDNPGHLKEEKDKAFAASEACLFQNQTSNNFLRGLEEIFMPSPIRIIAGRMGSGAWGGRPFGTTLPPTTTPPQPIEKLMEVEAAEPASNVTDSEDVESQTKLFGRKECAPKAKSFLCTLKEMKRLGDTDVEFRNATDSLRKGVELCKKVIEERCSPSTKDEHRCVSDAHLPLLLAFVDTVVDCMKDKGYTLPPLPLNFAAFSPRPRIFP